YANAYVYVYEYVYGLTSDSCVHLGSSVVSCPPVTGDLPAALRRPPDTLAPVPERFPAAALAYDLLERDLLPRTAGGDAYLIVGIVGPNKPGECALFKRGGGGALLPSGLP